MDQPKTIFDELHILLLEDNSADAELISARLAKARINCKFIQVQTRDAFCSAMQLLQRCTVLYS